MHANAVPCDAGTGRRAACWDSATAPRGLLRAGSPFANSQGAQARAKTVYKFGSDFSLLQHFVKFLADRFSGCQRHRGINIRIMIHPGKLGIHQAPVRLHMRGLKSRKEKDD